MRSCIVMPDLDITNAAYFYFGNQLAGIQSKWVLFFYLDM